jgi:hypothetical protein
MIDLYFHHIASPFKWLIIIPAKHSFPQKSLNNNYINHCKSTVFPSWIVLSHHVYWFQGEAPQLKVGLYTQYDYRYIPCKQASSSPL